METRVNPEKCHKCGAKAEKLFTHFVCLRCFNKISFEDMAKALDQRLSELAAIAVGKELEVLQAPFFWEVVKGIADARLFPPEDADYEPNDDAPEDDDVLDHLDDDFEDDEYEGD